MLRCLIILVTLTGCMSTKHAADRLECKPPLDWERAADLAEGEILTFGELHGTDQGPDAVAEYICAVASQRSGRTMVAVEISDRWEEQLSAALVAADPAEALIETMPDFWSGQDGRASQAVLRFLVRVAELQKAELDIDVVPFVNVSEKAFRVLREQGDQSLVEKGYAERILDRSLSAQRTIVMVGNIHAAQQAGQYTFVSFPPMASHFPEGSVSLDMFHDAGTAWNMTNGVGALKTSRARKRSDTEGPYPRIVFNEDLEPYFDGYLYVGPLTGSPPVVQAE